MWVDGKEAKQILSEEKRKNLKEALQEVISSMTFINGSISLEQMKLVGKEPDKNSLEYLINNLQEPK